MPQPILFRLQNQRSPRSRLWYGTSPFTPNVPLSFGQTVLISGVTKDSSGSILGSCIVKLYRTSDDTLQGSALSDATTGAYSLSAGPGFYYLVAYKPGSPDVAGTTVNTVEPVYGAVAGAVVTYRSVILADNPTSYWRLGESVGTNAADEQGVLNGTYTASPTLGVTGALLNDGNTAVTFLAASSQYVDISPGSGFGNGPFSGEAWVKMSSSGANFCIMNMPGITGSSGSIGITLGPSANGKITVTDGANRIVTTGATLYNDGVWHHVVFTKSAANVWHIYVDGVDVTVADSFPAQTTSTAGTAHGGIGCDYNVGTRRWFFTGTIDEVANYATELSLSQVQAHYHAAGY